MIAVALSAFTISNSSFGLTTYETILTRAREALSGEILVSELDPIPSEEEVITLEVNVP